MSEQMTATELLMAVADRMRKHGEADDVLVVWNHGRTARVMGNCNYTRALGLAQYAAVEMASTLLHSAGGDGEEEGEDN